MLGFIILNSLASGSTGGEEEMCVIARVLPCAHVCACVYKCVSVFTCVCVRVCECVCVCVNVGVCTHAAVAHVSSELTYVRWDTYL